MRHFPVFLNVAGARIAVSGAGETAVAKLRLLLKTDARINVFGTDPEAQVKTWAEEGRLHLHTRVLDHGDLICTVMCYAANDDPVEDARVAALARQYGALANIVDNLRDSGFITPAIVDRDPVTVAIGTEGAAPVLARRIKAQTEEALPGDLGTLARIAMHYRPAAENVPAGRARRAFWSAFYDETGPAALRESGEPGVHAALQALLARHAHGGSTGSGLHTATDVNDARHTPATAASHMSSPAGRVSLIGAGPGDPELLTLKARRTIHDADVVIHDRLVPAAVLELARREATIIEVAKTPYGPAWRQYDINAALVEHALAGAHIARLKSGDPAVYGRLDEEMDALDAAGIAFEIIPGITAAAAAAASIKTSLTQRGRNSALQILTGHDVNGFAEHDWKALARTGAAAAIYMGVRAARFLRGRLLMHGADPQTPVTCVENASRPDQRIIAATLATLPEALAREGAGGPTILFVGLAPRAAGNALPALNADADDPQSIAVSA